MRIQSSAGSFQPHRYSRTQHLWDDFAHAFGHADVLAIMDIYPAGEQPISGITAKRLAGAIQEAQPTGVHYVESMQAAVELFLREARPGDAILAIGAGSVGRALDQLTVLLQAEVATAHAH